MRSGVGVQFKGFSSRNFLYVAIADCLLRQEVRDEFGGFSRSLKSHRVTTAVQHRHLAVRQRPLQHSGARNVQHLRVQTSVLQLCVTLQHGFTDTLKYPNTT